MGNFPSGSFQDMAPSPSFTLPQYNTFAPTNTLGGDNTLNLAFFFGPLFIFSIFLVFAYKFRVWRCFYSGPLRRQAHEEEESVDVEAQLHVRATIAAAAAAQAASAAAADRQQAAAKIETPLPSFVYSAAASRLEWREKGSGVMECTICLSEFEEGEKGRTLPNCNHSFHAKCVDPWLLSHDTCPLCRTFVYQNHQDDYHDDVFFGINLAENVDLDPMTRQDHADVEMEPDHNQISTEDYTDVEMQSGQTMAGDYTDQHMETDQMAHQDDMDRGKGPEPEKVEESMDSPV